MANERLRNSENDRTFRIILVDIAACQYPIRDDGAGDPFLSQQPGAEATVSRGGDKVGEGEVEVDEILLLAALASGVITGAVIEDESLAGRAAVRREGQRRHFAHC
jgi:hypothetical protein